MSFIKSRSRVLGIVVGLTLFAAAVLAVVFLRTPTDTEEPPPMIRPLKTLVVGDEAVAPVRKYPGKVRANQKVIRTFQVSGRLIELPIKRGDKVKKGQLLARLDPRDFQSKLNTNEALLRQRTLDVERYQKAYDKKVATQKELDDAKAGRDAAKAQRDIAAKALEDTRLIAPFSGVIADRFVENFQDVDKKQDILSLQEIDEVEVVINVPERRVSELRKTKPKLYAVFDFLSDREFPVQIKEFATDADAATQTFQVTMIMPAPKDVRILPGMTATIVEKIAAPTTSTNEYRLPLAAVPADEAGQYYVWKVTPTKTKDIYVVARQNVSVGPLKENDVLVKTGVTKGDRIAAAGVHFLKEGQEVRLFVSRGEKVDPAPANPGAGQ